MSNDQIVSKVLGSMTSEEELDIMRALQSAQQEMATGTAAPASITDDLLADLRNEALGVLGSQSRSALAQELGAEDGELGINANSNCEGGSDNLLSPVGESSAFTVLEKSGPEVDLVDKIGQNQRIEDLNNKRMRRQKKRQRSNWRL